MKGLAPALRFPDTSWTLLVQAGGEGEEAEAARATFADRYYRPVYAYLTAIVRDPEKGKELTQDFFESRILTGQLMRGANRATGNFRPFLKQALRNFVNDYWRKVRRSPRETSEGEGDTPPQGGTTPEAEREFHNQWVRALLEEALDRVRQVCEANGQHVHYDLFLGRYLSKSTKPPPWKELGTPFVLDEKTARSRADTVARHFRAVLREMLGQEIEADAGTDEEIGALLAGL